MSAIPIDTEPDIFRGLVRAWFDEHAPAKGSAGDFSNVHVVSASTIEEYDARESAALETTRAWQRQRYDAGLAGRSWPTEYGGLGAPAWQDDVIDAEQMRYGVSTKMLAIALDMVPPVLTVFGTDELRTAHLPLIVRGDESWCQLLSEPDAGSDLTSVNTTATPVEGGWSISGQKVWTSGAGTAAFALLIARTNRDVPGRGGLSCFAMAMDQPGITVRPLRQISGAYHFNEVFLDDAFVPDGGLVGELGGGWTVLRTMLASERASIGGGTSVRGATALRAMVQELGIDGDKVVRQEVVAAIARERLLDLTQARIAAGSAVPAAGSVAKLLYTEHGRITSDSALRIVGAAGMVDADPLSEQWVDRFLFAPGLRIGGGTDEIQRNTIAERGLGLPREPDPLRGQTP
jgi:alkylation response protein AidB-like acyl-CoA dehydrogenase